MGFEGGGAFCRECVCMKYMGLKIEIRIKRDGGGARGMWCDTATNTYSILCTQQDIYIL